MGRRMASGIRRGVWEEVRMASGIRRGVWEDAWLVE